MLLSPQDYLQRCTQDILPILDVRAPVEFADGHIPHSCNIPILTDEERHLVGLAYKTEGNAAATQLGHTLVAPNKEQRIAAWATYLAKQRVPLLTCWRGGDRSRIAQEWLRDRGVDTLRLQGGYKALRNELTQQFSLPLHGYSLSGFTGTGKTDFIRSLQHSAALDLEGMANHRGSSFGSYGKNSQPSQATFENALGLALWRAGFPRSPLFLESESRMIGRVVIPTTFFTQMRQIPRIVLETPWSERLENIYREYVEVPLATATPVDLQNTLLAAAHGIRDRLGGLRYSELCALINSAFNQPNDKEGHLHWITYLLKHYYDPMYEHSLLKFTGTIAFRGPAAALRDWLTNQTDFFRH